MQRKDLFEKYKDDMKSYLENMTPEEMKLEGRRKQQKMTKKLKRVNVLFSWGGFFHLMRLEFSLNSLSL